MELRDHLIAPVAVLDPDEDQVTLDIGGLVRRLLLFERYTIESIHLRDIASMCAVFGFDGVKMLLESGAVRVLCEVRAVAQIGQWPERVTLTGDQKKPVLPLAGYCFSVIRSTDHRQFISRCMASVDHAPGLTGRQAIKLKELLARRLVAPPDLSNPVLSQLLEDLENRSSWVQRAVARTLSDHLGKQVPISEIDLRVHRLDENDVQSESNLTSRFGLQDEEAHRVLERAFLGVAGLNHRIEQMRALNGVNGCQQDDLGLFEEKLSFVASSFDPEAQERRLSRVIALAELPDPDAADAQAINIERLLEIRDSDDCRAVRRWLRDTDGESDDEIRDSFHAIQEKLKRAFHSRRGRAARLAVSTGVGIIPGAGLLAGPATSAIDTFVLEKVVSKPGPYSFLSRDYPKIFDSKWNTIGDPRDPQIEPS